MGATSFVNDSFLFFVIEFQLFIFRRREATILTRLFTDTRVLTDNLRLRGAMLNHHMPWSYDTLFAGYGEAVDNVQVEFFEQVLTVAKS